MLTFKTRQGKAILHKGDKLFKDEIGCSYYVYENGIYRYDSSGDVIERNDFQFVVHLSSLAKAKEVLLYMAERM